MYVNCNRCGGSGTVPHKHIANGTCFACGGSGKISVFEAQDKLDLFYKSGQPLCAGTGVLYSMTKGTKRINKGGEYTVYMTADKIVVWNVKAGANWHFSIDLNCMAVFTEYFMPIEGNKA